MPVSLCHKSVFYRRDRAGFWHEGSVQSVLCYKEIQVPYVQKSGHFPIELCHKLWTLKKFRHATSIVATCCRLSLTQVDAQCYKLAGPSSVDYKLTMPAAVDR